MIGVTYHYVRPAYAYPYSGINGVTTQVFREQMIMLRGISTFVSLKQVLEAVRTGIPLPDNAVLITFDDGLREHVEHALPILDELEIPAVFYVNTASIDGQKMMSVHMLHHLMAHFPLRNLLSKVLEVYQSVVGRSAQLAEDAIADKTYKYGSLLAKRFKYFLNYTIPFKYYDVVVARLFEEIWQGSKEELYQDLYMNRCQVQMLASRGYLGSHGHDHVNLGRLSQVEATRDIVVARDLLEAWTGEKLRSFCYPYGTLQSCPIEIAQLVQKLGYEMAVTVERGVNCDFLNPMFVGRYDCNDVPGGKSFTGDIQSFFEDLPRCQFGT